MASGSQALQFVHWPFHRRGVNRKAAERGEGPRKILTQKGVSMYSPVRVTAELPTVGRGGEASFPRALLGIPKNSKFEKSSKTAAAAWDRWQPSHVTVDPVAEPPRRSAAIRFHGLQIIARRFMDFVRFTAERGKAPGRCRPKGGEHVLASPRHR